MHRVEKSHLLGWHSQSYGYPEKVIVTNINADDDESKDDNADDADIEDDEDDGDNEADDDDNIEDEDDDNDNLERSDMIIVKDTIFPRIRTFHYWTGWVPDDDGQDDDNHHHYDEEDDVDDTDENWDENYDDLDAQVFE